MKEKIMDNILYIGWVQAILAVGGSLFFSEILRYPPCVLCWWQRVAIYPMVILFAVGIHKKDRNLFWYAMPILFVGWCISIFHNLLYYKIIPDTLAPCELGVSCTTKYIEWFGFVTIPSLAFMALSIMMVTLYIFYKRTPKMIGPKE